MAVDDISLEPLFNRSSRGTGADKTIAFSLIDIIGQAEHRSAITVNSTPQEITPSVGKTTIELQNTGSNVIYYGGTGVSSTTGIKIFPNQTKVWANVKDDFSVYIVCAAGETSEGRVVEYD